MKKRIVVIALAILLADSALAQTSFGLRIVDSSGFSAEVGDPSWSVDTPFLKKGDEEAELSIGSIAKADFDWKNSRVSITTPEGDTKVYAVAGSTLEGPIQIKGLVYQAGFPCAYGINLWDVRTVSRISAAVPSGNELDSEVHRKISCRITHLKGGSRSLTDVHFYYRGSSESGYSMVSQGASYSIREQMLLGEGVLRMRLGKGSYDVPLSQISNISFKNKSFLTASGFRCPFAGPLDVVVVAGQAPMGRVALYPQSIDEMSLSVAAGEEPPPRDQGAKQELKWSLSGFRAGSTAPSLALSNVRAEVYSPEINWNAAGSALAFRAALEDYSESVRVNKDQTEAFLDKTFESRSVPLQVGAEYWAVPFSTIKDLAIDPHGLLTLTLRDGSILKGNAYQNWKGFVGDGPQGETHVALRNLPPRLSFVERGKVFGAGLGITGSIVDSTQHHQGQRDYLASAMTLTIENDSSSPVHFGTDILLMECTQQMGFNGAYVAYAAGSPEKKPEMAYLDSESWAYGLANFEEWWSDGTMRGFRNGGPYLSGDPPDHHAEATICNSTLAPGASIKLEKEFTQGSFVDPHYRNRVLVALPAVSRGADKARLVLSFVKPDSSRDEWLLDSAQVVRLTRDDLLATLKSAEYVDLPLSVLALHWLTDLDPAVAAPFIDKNILSCAPQVDRNIRLLPAQGLDLVASIQLLANSHLQPGPEALSVINKLASGGDGWAALVAKRYLSAAR